MYAATGFELFTGGLGTGAFSVLLLRMTQKRFSATQYALFSSLFALPRLLAGPDRRASSWTPSAGGPFFLSTLAMGIPGLVMLARFVPIGVREPEFTVEEVKEKAPLSNNALAVRGVLGALLSGAFALGMTALLAALKIMREKPEAGFDFHGRPGAGTAAGRDRRLAAVGGHRRVCGDRRPLRRGRHRGPPRGGTVDRRREQEELRIEK